MARANPWKTEQAQHETYDGTEYLNWYRCVDGEGEPCSSSPGDYFMRHMDEPLSLTLQRKVLVHVTLASGEHIIASGWHELVSVTRRELAQLRIEGAYFDGDTYTL